MPDNIVVEGNWGTVEYATKTNGKMPAKEFIDCLQNNEKSKLSHPLKKFAEVGKIFNPEKFRKIKGIKESIFEIKSGKVRILCFQRGNRLILTNGFFKGSPAKKEFLKAINIINEHLESIERKGI